MSRGEWGFAFAGPRILLANGEDGPRVPSAEEVGDLVAGEVVSTHVDVPMQPVEGRAVRLLDLGEGFSPPEGFELFGLREIHGLVPDGHFRTAGTARQKIDWIRTHRFCSRCATPLVMHASHEGLVCPECRQMHFPRLAPAVIVLVQRGREALLGRSPRFVPEVYSTLAGFVEPGESLEECVHREIHEEVGVRVHRLRYFGSQPHPFPHSLMVGFIADWKEGEIEMDPEEIEDARWFTPDALPRLPHPMSIARALIEDWIQRVG